MYFPKGFDLDRAIELGTLVDEAYTQFEAFTKEKPWNIPSGYTLKRELNYLKHAGRSPINNSGFLDLDLRGSGRADGQQAVDVPIGFIAQRKNDVFLIFRGTVTDQEWLRNFTIRLAPYPLQNFGKVHEGFLQIFDLFRPAIVESLRGLDRRSRLYIAGHSLGGALATIAMPELGTFLRRADLDAYTFGSPRLGDRIFAAAYNRQCAARSFRIVNSSDIVGLIPPPAPIFGPIGGYFAHVDTPISFCVQKEDLVLNHHIRTYIDALKESRAERGFLQKLKFW